MLDNLTKRMGKHGIRLLGPVSIELDYSFEKLKNNNK